MYRPAKRRRAKRLSLAYDILRLPQVSRPLWLIGLVLLGLLLLPYLIAPFYAFGQPVSTVMLWRRMVGERVERIYVPLSRVSPALSLAVIVAEDGRFCTHYGVDFQEIQNALDTADDLGDMRGASTITQQVAKNLFLWPGHSFLRKALEFPLALWIDLVLSKRRILEIYLNIAEWGPNGEFGVEAGAERAFHKSARHLSRYQAALLAAVLPNPHDRDARHPGRGLRRLAALYVARSRAASGSAGCLRRGR
jgi:monofunctional biosynthetic peptidoglycan transglycosylase